MRDILCVIRRPWIQILVLAVLLPQAIQAHALTKLFGVIYNDAEATEALATIDPATAAATLVGTTIPDCCYVSAASTLDAGSSVMYFVGNYLSETTGPQRLFALDLKTGAILSSPFVPVSFELDFIEYDPASRKLLGFIWDIASETEKLVSINPATAAATNIGAGVSQCCQVSAPPALDRSAGIIYLIGTMFAESSPRLFGFNTQTGSIITQPVYTSSLLLDFIEYDAGSGKLLGFVYDDASQTEKLATINSATAGVTTIGSGISQCCEVLTPPTLDPAAGIIYLPGGVFSESSKRLLGFNTSTGAVVSNPFISDSIFLDFIEAAVSQPPFGDVDGDAKSDITVWRPSDGTWYTVPSKNPTTYQTTNWGVASDIPAPGDYDGDGKMDIAVWRPANGTWYVRKSSVPGSYTSTHWGTASDIPAPGDYDGDGKYDSTVWRPSNGTWYVQPSSNPSTYQATNWGTSSDIPVSGDYDGDGKADIAVWRPSTGTWYVRKSSVPGSYETTKWGASTDIPSPGDYDGDGKTDVAVWRPNTGTWFVRPSGTPGTYTTTAWGTSGDIPVSGDYDGDGKSDLAVWRPSNAYWYIKPSGTPGSYTSKKWGTAGDIPISSITSIVTSIP